MNLLNAALYDPGTAVTNKATSSLLALTAFDTTNLRLTVTAPPGGRLWIVIICTIHGATTCPQIILGCLEGATVRGRVTPEITVSNLAATSLYRARAEYCLTGLTPGQSYVLDAAYGVETVVASTNIKYGGPNNTTGNDNFGAFQFEIWDPSPSYTPAANGVAPTSTVHVKLDAIDDFVDTEVGAIKTKTDFLPSVTAGAAGGLFIAGANAATSITTALTANLIGNVTGSLSGSVGSVTGAVGSVTGAVGSVTGAVGSVTGAVGSVTGFTAADVGLIKAKTDNLPSDPADASVIAGRFDSVDSAIAGISAGSGLDAAGVRDAIGLASANLDTQLAALPTAAEIHAELTELDNLDAAVSTRMATFEYTAPDNTGIAAVQAKTDSLNFTVAGKLDANVLVINGVTVSGVGTAGSPWGPA